MVVARSTRHIVSPVLLVGVVSAAIVTGVSALRYASAEEPGDTTAHSMNAEAKSSVSTDSELNVQVESSATSGDATQAPASGSPTSQQGEPSVAQGSATVNGQTYTVPGDGELHTTVSDANGQTSVDISVQSSGSGQNYSSSSSNVHVFSNSFNVSQSTGGTSP